MKITPKNIINNLLPMLVINSFGILMLIYMFEDYDNLYIISYLFLFFYSILPTLILTWNYYRKNHTIDLHLHKDEIEISYNTLNKKIIKIEKIESIKFIGPKNYFEKYNIRFSTFDNNYYVEIHLIDGSQIKLTSLLNQNLRNELYKIYSNLIYSYKYTSFPYLN
ncbi:hypothetical protein [Flavobacterium sp. I3-2]|uniref:hypothetical protein n=1 Tax=Flavobacterium sp. I3-2 TaxID=2748319 RepID=UPI0015AFD60C|nr:hypothetical protein [Flavobacterium sp. I3-2]